MSIRSEGKNERGEGEMSFGEVREVTWRVGRKGRVRERERVVMLQRKCKCVNVTEARYESI